MCYLTSWGNQVLAESESPAMIFFSQPSFLQGAKLTGGDRVLLKEDTGSGGDVEAGAVRDNEEDEVLFDVKNFSITFKHHFLECSMCTSST